MARIQLLPIKTTDWILLALILTVVSSMLGLCFGNGTCDSFLSYEMSNASNVIQTNF